MRVFISYAHEDRARMLMIADAVRAAGHDVQADEGILQVGDDFARKIEATIAGCDALIVLWSKASCSKPWVPSEANLALSHKKRVLSIKIEACSPPLPFSTFHMLDLTASGDLGPLLRSLDPAGYAKGLAMTMTPRARRPSWPVRLAGAAIAVAVLSVGAWLMIPGLREKPQPPTPQATIADAGAVTPPPVVTPDAGPPPAPDAGATVSKVRPKAPATDPCAAAKARFDQVQADCSQPCDLDHYPMREDLDRCRACDTLRAKVTTCSPSRP